MNIPEKLSREELDKFMPHKGKMYLLSRVNCYSIEDCKIETEVDIDEKCIFFDDDMNGVPNYVGFEFMAQSISALTGIGNALKGRPSLPGMVLSVSDFDAIKPFYKNGSTLKINVMEDYFDAETKIFRYACTISDGDEKIVSAKITVMEVENFDNVLK